MNLNLFSHRASTRAALFLLLSGVALLFAAAKPARAESIRWASSFQAAMSEARATQRPVMVDFYTDWCGWCKKLDAETYTDARVVAQSRGFISVKVNAEREGVQLARQYQVSGYPHIVFMNENGLVLDRIGGYMEGPGFAAALGNIRSRYRPSGAATRSAAVASTMTRSQIYAKQRAAIQRALKNKSYGRGKATDGEPIILRGSSTQIGADGLILVRDTPSGPTRRPSSKKKTVHRTSRVKR